MDQNTANDGVTLHQPNASQPANIAITEEFFDNIASKLAHATGDINQARHIAKQAVVEHLLRKAGIKQVDDMASNLDHIYGMDIQVLQRDNQGLQSDIQIYLRENEELQDKNYKLQEEKEALKTDNKGLQAEYEELDTEIERLNLENEELRVEKETLRIEYKELQAGYKELDAEIERLRYKNDELQHMRRVIFTAQD
ncbi:uncharacterized protein PG998_006457 [Apiospora kogelbergensis]|uniref:uncharacterized protein n=1 Tax=Apiospora kogelbergensis TaxID=1337665 RepID=UPI00312F0AAB